MLECCDAVREGPFAVATVIGRWATELQSWELRTWLSVSIDDVYELWSPYQGGNCWVISRNLYQDL